MRNMLKRISAVFILIAFLASSCGAPYSFARERALSTLAPGSIFSHLTNPEKRHLAILEYEIMTNIISKKIDPLSQEKDVSLSHGGKPVSFRFSGSLIDKDLGLCLVPCSYGDSGYWCFLKLSTVKGGSLSGKYEVMIYTERELADVDREKLLYRAKIEKRKEAAAIAMAAESEFKHDEIIREAINAGRSLRIMPDQFPVQYILMFHFLSIAAPELRLDLQKLVEDGQLMVILDPRLKEPHAGGKGIYLPNDQKYKNSATIVHESFAKAGFTHEEASCLEAVYTRFVEYFTDNVLDRPYSLPEYMSLSTGEKRLLAEAKSAQFIDLTEKIDTRDYSATGGKRPGNGKKDAKISVKWAKEQQAAKLKEVQDYFTHIITNIGAAVFVKDEEGRFLFVSAGECHLTGFTQEDMIGSTDEDLYSHEQVEIFRKNDLHVLKTGEQSVSEELLTDAQDVTHIIVTTKTRYIDSSGRRYIVGVSRDITEERRHERDTAFLASIIEGTNDIACIKDLDLRVITANAAFLRLTGMKLEEVVGKTDAEIFKGKIPDETIAQYMEDDRRALKLSQGQYIEKEERAVTSTGADRALFTRKFPIFNSEGKVIATANISSDITERKKADDARRHAEAQMRESERKNRDMIMTCPIGMALFDAQGRMVMANSSFQNIFGMPERELVNKSMTDFWGAIETGEASMPMARSIRIESRVNYDKALQHGILGKNKTGETWLDLLITPQSNEEGARTGFLFSVQDITEKKADALKLQAAYRQLGLVNIELKEAYRQLEEKTALLVQAGKLSAIGEITAAIIHEINNPLSNMQFLNSSLVEDVDSGEETDLDNISHRVHRVNKEISRMARMTSRFLGFVRAEDYGKSPCYLEDAIQDVLELRQAMIRTRGIKIACSFEEDLSVIIADKAKLEQVFLNIVMNAVDAMKYSEKRELAIKVRRSKDSEGRDVVSASISDTGCGILPEDIGNIWKPFYTKRQGEGTGLGLSVSLDIIRANNGTVKVESTPGIGSVFTLQFPVAPEEDRGLKDYTDKAIDNIYGSFLHDFANVLSGMLKIESLKKRHMTGEHAKAFEALDGLIKEVLAKFRIEQEKGAVDTAGDFVRGARLLLNKLAGSISMMLASLDPADTNTMESLSSINRSCRTAINKIERMIKMLSIISELKKRHSMTIDTAGSMDDMAKLFSESKRFFMNSGIKYEGTRTLDGSPEDLSIRGYDPEFRLAIYSILIAGMEACPGIIISNDADKKVSISIEHNRRIGEVMIAVKNNFYEFDEKSLTEVDYGSGEKGPAILKADSGELSHLAAARMALRLMGGRIAIDNVKGDSGSVIMVYLPAARSEREEPVETVNGDKDDEEQNNGVTFERKSTPGKPNIIVVDDEPVQLELFHELLSDSDYNLWFASNAQEAYDMIAKLGKEGIKLNLGIFDVSMPMAPASNIEDGFMLAEKVRDAGYQFPVLINTGHGLGSARQIALQKAGVIAGAMGKTVTMAQKKVMISEALKLGMPKETKATELQAKSAGKVALVYGQEFEKGVQALKSVGFKGEILAARNEIELRSLLKPGQHYDVIINASNEDISALIRDIMPGLQTLPAIINDVKDKYRLQTELLKICA